MKTLIRALAVTAAGALGLLASGVPFVVLGGAADRHVIVISIDGFAAFHLNDETLDLPNIRALASAGARALSSESVFPSMTHPAHTTLITGVEPRGHGVVGNRVVDRLTGRRFHITNLPRADSVKVPTLFDVAHAHGMGTAAFFWPETKDDPSIDDNFAEVFDSRDMADSAAIAPAFLQELRDTGIPIDAYFALYDDPFTQGAADLVLTRAAAYVLTSRKPALLVLHLLVADKVQHEVGADHVRSRAALMTADHCVGVMRRAVADAGIADRTTFVITADHGFVSVHDQINLSPILDVPALEGRIRWQADGWYVWGELLPAFDSSRDAAALEQVLRRVAALPGIARVVRPGEFAALGYPEFAENRFVPGHYLIASTIDAHLVLNRDSADTSRRARQRPYHGHGYFPSHEKMHASLVFSGAGIRPGAVIGRVRNIDVAPTIAALLGLELTTATGRVLEEALQ